MYLPPDPSQRRAGRLDTLISEEPAMWLSVSGSGAADLRLCARTFTLLDGR